MPWISTEEFMSFDFEKASLEAPPRGPRYRALPRVIDRMAEAKAFCRVDLVHSKNLALSKARQAACLVEASKLVEEMQERGVTPTVHVLNAHLSVYSKSLQFGEAREFLAEQFGAANLKPNQQTFLHLIEMYIRGGRLKEALDLKEEMASSFGLRPGSAVLGQLVRKLADLDRLMEALALLDEAQDAGIKIRERNIRELRRRLERDQLPLHPLIGPDPEKWRIDMNAERRTKKKIDNRVAHQLRNMIMK